LKNKGWFGQGDKKQGMPKGCGERLNGTRLAEASYQRKSIRTGERVFNDIHSVGGNQNPTWGGNQ